MYTATLIFCTGHSFYSYSGHTHTHTQSYARTRAQTLVSYTISSTHWFSKQKNRFLLFVFTTCWRTVILLTFLFFPHHCLCFLSFRFARQMKSLSSASKAAAISSASELLPPSSSLESFEDSSAESSLSFFFPLLSPSSSSSSSSSPSLASSCLRLWPLRRQKKKTELRKERSYRCNNCPCF